ncbi:MAG: hypothetical protein ABEH81_00835 [Halopenitus sp.]
MDGRRKAGRTNPYVYLANNGPSIHEEIPNEIHSKERKSGIRRFNMKGRGVYYIEGKHSKKRVVEKWSSSHQAVIENKSEWSFAHLAPDGFNEAVMEVLDYDNPNGKSGGEQNSRPCPVCGEEEILQFPNHAPDYPELN